MQQLTFSLEGMIVQEFEQNLDTVSSLDDPHKATQIIAYLVQKHNIKCIEIDEYIKKFKPRYIKALDAEIQRSSDFARAKGRQKDQLLHKLKLKAIKTLEINLGAFTYNLFCPDANGRIDPWTIAYLIYGTYSRNKAVLRERAQLLDLDLQDIRGYEIINSENCCPCCQKLAKKRYNKYNFPELPFHIGCCCSIAPVFTY